MSEPIKTPPIIRIQIIRVDSASWSRNVVSTANETGRKQCCDRPMIVGVLSMTVSVAALLLRIWNSVSYIISQTSTVC